jgi:hypothetical protein
MPKNHPVRNSPEPRPQEAVSGIVPEGPSAKHLPKRTPGIWKGKVKISRDFDTLPESIAAAFRGERIIKT